MEVLRGHRTDARILEAAGHASFTAPPREGFRPQMPDSIPHLQITQWPPDHIVHQLMQRCLSLEHVRPKEGRMATKGSCALSLPDLYADGPRDAFIDTNEFCHLHPLPEGSLHLTLPSPFRNQVIELGWAEQHPAVRSGTMPQSLVTVYAPRDTHELGIVLQLIRISWQFARGVLHSMTAPQD